MSDNPYSPPSAALPSETPKNMESVQARKYRLGIKGLVWIFIGYGSIMFLDVIIALYERSESVAFDSMHYASFFIPALTIQSGFLLKDRSKWSIATCLSIVLLLVFVLVRLYQPSRFDQRSICRIILETAPTSLIVLLCGYSLLTGILGMLWRAKQLR